MRVATRAPAIRNSCQSFVAAGKRQLRRSDVSICLPAGRAIQRVVSAPSAQNVSAGWKLETPCASCLRSMFAYSPVQPRSFGSPSNDSSSCALHATRVALVGSSRLSQPRAARTRLKLHVSTLRAERSMADKISQAAAASTPKQRYAHDLAHRPSVRDETRADVGRHFEPRAVAAEPRVAIAGEIDAILIGHVPAECLDQTIAAVERHHREVMRPLIEVHVLLADLQEAARVASPAGSHDQREERERWNVLNQARRIE